MVNSPTGQSVFNDLVTGIRAGKPHKHGLVEAAGPKRRFVNGFGPVCRPDNDGEPLPPATVRANREEAVERLNGLGDSRGLFV